MQHVRAARRVIPDQGKIERWHQTLKNRILLDNYYLSCDLERQGVDDVGRVKLAIDADCQTLRVNSSMVLSMLNFLPLWERRSTKSWD
jgi:hypothetical protein